jgi:uncharacterized Zn finger protein (UPF0148 family)
MKILKIKCPECKNTVFKPDNGTYTCESCGYALTDKDKDKILTEAYKQHKAALKQERR